MAKNASTPLAMQWNWVECFSLNETRDYFDATASNWNTSAHHAPWRVSLYKDRQSNRRVGVF